MVVVLLYLHHALIEVMQAVKLKPPIQVIVQHHHMCVVHIVYYILPVLPVNFIQALGTELHLNNHLHQILPLLLYLPRDYQNNVRPLVLAVPLPLLRDHLYLGAEYPLPPVQQPLHAVEVVVVVPPEPFIDELVLDSQRNIIFPVPEKINLLLVDRHGCLLPGFCTAEVIINFTATITLLIAFIYVLPQLDLAFTYKLA